MGWCLFQEVASLDVSGRDPKVGVQPAITWEHDSPKVGFSVPTERFFTTGSSMCCASQSMVLTDDWDPKKFHHDRHVLVQLLRAPLFGMIPGWVRITPETSGPYGKPWIRHLWNLSDSYFQVWYLYVTKVCLLRHSIKNFLDIRMSLWQFCLLTFPARLEQMYSSHYNPSIVGTSAVRWLFSCTFAVPFWNEFMYYDVLCIYRHMVYDYYDQPWFTRSKHHHYPLSTIKRSIHLPLLLWNIMKHVY